VPKPSALPVYSGVSNDTPTCDSAARFYLVRLHRLHDADRVGGVRQIPVVQEEPGVVLVRADV
jgi:hypothetical protein